MTNVSVNQLALLAACCAALCAVVELRRLSSVAEEWQEAYSKVFDMSGQIYEPTEISEYTMFLYSRIDQLGEQSSVMKNMIDNVIYSFDAMTDTNTEHCNTQHLDEVKKRLESIRGPIDGNLKAVFALVHRNLVEVCGLLHYNVKNALEISLSRADKSDLLSFWMSYSEFARERVSKEMLRAGLLRQISIKPTSAEEHINQSWNNGACKKLDEALVRLDLQSFREFSRLNAYNGILAAQSCQPVIADWALFVYSCERINDMMPDLAKTQLKEQNLFTRLIRGDLKG